MVNLLSNIFRHNWFAIKNQNLEKQTCKLTENVTALHPPNHLRGQPIRKRSFVSPGPCVKPVAGCDTNKQGQLGQLVPQHDVNHQEKCEKVVRFHLEPSLISNNDYEDDGINVMHGAEELLSS
jgi:hypothetical protein